LQERRKIENMGEICRGRNSKFMENNMGRRRVKKWRMVRERIMVR
jgi:hypothetical protein